MKHFPILISLALALFCSCQKSSENVIDELETGTATKGSYQNKSLGWTMSLPTDYVIKAARNDDARPGASAEAQRMKRKKQLLAICQEVQNCNNSLVVMAQDTNSARKTNSPENYSGWLVAQDEEHNTDYKVTGHYKKGTEKFGGKEFHMLEIRRQNPYKDFQKLTQVHYFRLFGPHFVTITMNYETDQQKEILLKALNSSKFEDPN